MVFNVMLIITTKSSAQTPTTIATISLVSIIFSPSKSECVVATFLKPLFYRFPFASQTDRAPFCACRIACLIQDSGADSRNRASSRTLAAAYATVIRGKATGLTLDFKCKSTVQAGQANASARGLTHTARRRPPLPHLSASG